MGYQTVKCVIMSKIAYQILCECVALEHSDFLATKIEHKNITTNQSQ